MPNRYPLSEKNGDVATEDQRWVVDVLMATAVDTIYASRNRLVVADMENQQSGSAVHVGGQSGHSLFNAFMQRVRQRIVDEFHLAANPHHTSMWFTLDLFRRRWCHLGASLRVTVTQHSPVIYIYGKVS